MPLFQFAFIDFFFFNATAPTKIYTLSLHDALPITAGRPATLRAIEAALNDKERRVFAVAQRSEEHTSELQSRRDLVCRLLLEKKKKKIVELIQIKKKKYPTNK